MVIVHPPLPSGFVSLRMMYLKSFLLVCSIVSFHHIRGNVMTPTSSVVATLSLCPLGGLPKYHCIPFQDTGKGTLIAVAFQ